MEEVFRIIPTPGKCYEHAEYTNRLGHYPEIRYFTNVQPRYVGVFVRFEAGGHGDGSWRTDYFNDNGTIIVVPYSYEGRTCFREVPCHNKKLLEGGKHKKSYKKKVNKNKRKSRKNKRMKK